MLGGIFPLVGVLVGQTPPLIWQRSFMSVRDRWRSSVCAVALALAGATGCSSGPANGFAVTEPEGYSLVGTTLRQGDMAVIGGLPLIVEKGAGPISVESVSLSGVAMNASVASVSGVGVYAFGQNLGPMIGTGDAQRAQELLDGDFLTLPVTVGGESTLAVAAVVSARATGKWRADFIEITYRSQGGLFTQKIASGFGLCVVVGDPLAETCDVGRPATPIDDA